MFVMIASGLDAFGGAACRGGSHELPGASHGVATGNASLSAAHDAYLGADYVAMGEHIRDVLLDPTSTGLAKENALELLDKAFEVNHGVLPSQFRPPASVRSLQYLSRQFVAPTGRSIFQVRFAGSMKDASELVGLTVRHLPDGLVLDKRGGGSFEIRHDPPFSQHGLEEFVLDSQPLDAPLADGVVSIRLELRDGTVSEGFVISHGLGATELPNILTPGPMESVTDATPLVRWALPERAGATPFEHQRTIVHVNRAGEGEALWLLGSENGGGGEVRIGSAEGSTTTKLAPGSYEVFVSPGELRHFGPVEVAHASRVSRAFHVVAP
jgi:hypothetical protein